MSEANRTSLKSIAEATYGTTPTTGAFQDMRFTGHSLGAVPQHAISNEIRSDRMVPDMKKVSEQVGGAVNIEFSLNTFDEWLEALLCGTWATDVLKAGVVERSFSLEYGMHDWSPAQYLQWKGMRIAGASFRFPFGAIADGSFNFVGKQALASTTTLVGGSNTLTAKTSTEVLNGSGDIASVTLDSGTGVIIKSVNLNIDNTMRPIEGIGSISPMNQSYGRSRITGSVEMYFDSIAQYNKLINDQTAELEFTLNDGGGQTLAILIPKLKWTGGSPPNTGPDTDNMANFSFEAIYDSVTQTNIRLTRTP